MDGSGEFAKARSLLGRQVKVWLSYHDLDPQSVAEGRLMAIADSGEIVIQDDSGFLHYCWPMLSIEAI